MLSIGPPRPGLCGHPKAPLITTPAVPLHVMAKSQVKNSMWSCDSMAHCKYLSSSAAPLTTDRCQHLNVTAAYGTRLPRAMWHTCRSVHYQLGKVHVRCMQAMSLRAPMPVLSLGCIEMRTVCHCQARCQWHFHLRHFV